MPWHAPPGLGISTSGLNFADIKIDGSLSDGTSKDFGLKMMPEIIEESKNQYRPGLTEIKKNKREERHISVDYRMDDMKSVVQGSLQG